MKARLHSRKLASYTISVRTVGLLRIVLLFTKDAPGDSTRNTDKKSPRHHQPVRERGSLSCKFQSKIHQVNHGVGTTYSVLRTRVNVSIQPTEFQRLRMTDHLLKFTPYMIVITPIYSLYSEVIPYRVVLRKGRKKPSKAAPQKAKKAPTFRLGNMISMPNQPQEPIGLGSQQPYNGKSILLGPA